MWERIIKCEQDNKMWIKCEHQQNSKSWKPNAEILKLTPFSKLENSKNFGGPQIILA